VTSTVQKQNRVRRPEWRCHMILNIITQHSSRRWCQLGAMAHTCNPRYWGGRNQEDHSSKPAGQIVLETLCQKTNHKKRAGGVAQGVDLEFKPQYHTERVGGCLRRLQQVKELVMWEFRSEACAKALGWSLLACGSRRGMCDRRWWRLSLCRASQATLFGFYAKQKSDRI
jgi:hypothetical protein